MNWKTPWIRFTGGRGRNLRSELAKKVAEMQLRNGSVLADAISTVFGRTRTPIEAIILIGSVALLNESSHDVDVAVFLRKRDFDNPEALIRRLRAEFKGIGAVVVREPRFIHDEQLRRIESMVKVRGILLDVVFTDGEPVIGDTAFTIYRDNLEVFLGNLYVYGKVLYAKVHGRYQRLRKRHLMLYQGLRISRLAIFREEFSRYVKSAKTAASSGDLFKALRAFNLSILLFLKYAFARKNVYPLNLEKHLEAQARLILGNPNVIRRLISVLAETKLTCESLADSASALTSCFDDLDKFHGDAK
jgi:hypothetical protein